MLSSQELVVGSQEKSKEKIVSFQDLEVWKQSHKYVLEIYKICSKFPNDERYGLTSQIKRAAVSIAANIAEGFTRRSQNDKVHFYNIAQASLHESKYYLILAKDLNFIESNAVLWKMSEEIGKMLYGLIGSIKVNYTKR